MKIRPIGRNLRLRRARIPKDWQCELKSVLLAFSWCCRNPLAGFLAVGQWDGEELSHIKALAEFTVERVKEIRRERHEFFGFDEEEPVAEHIDEEMQILKEI
jgi:hypothetical protein